MNDWQPTMQIREVWSAAKHTLNDFAGGSEIAITERRFERIEQLYRHIHTGDTEWRPIERVEEL